MKGLHYMLSSQPNAWLHSLATVVVILAGIGRGLTRLEWIFIFIAIILVWVAEVFNTALEVLANAVSLEHHPLIGLAKDIAAGAVLIAAVGACVIGLFVFFY